MTLLLQSKSTQWALLLFLALTWGSSFILMKQGLRSFDSNQVASYRMFISFLVLLPFVFTRLKLLNRQNFVFIILVGLFGNFIPAYLFTKAQTVLSSSYTGMLNSIVPVFTTILGVAFFKIKPSKINIIGILIGFIGALGLLQSQGVDIQNTQFSYTFYVILATLCYATTVNIIKQYLKKMEALAITSLAFLFIGPLSGIHLFTTDFITILQTDSNALKNLGYITLLGIVGTSLSVYLFNLLIKETTPLFATSVTYIIPIIAILWGVLDGETIGFDKIMWIITILGGVYLVNKSK